jgi:hypothetical protein
MNKTYGTIYRENIPNFVHVYFEAPVCFTFYLESLLKFEEKGYVFQIFSLKCFFPIIHKNNLHKLQYSKSTSEFRPRYAPKCYGHPSFQAHLTLNRQKSALRVHIPSITASLLLSIPYHTTTVLRYT